MALNAAWYSWIHFTPTPDAEFFGSSFRAFHAGMDGSGQGRSAYRHCHCNILVLGKKLSCKSMLQALSFGRKQSRTGHRTEAPCLTELSICHQRRANHLIPLPEFGKFILRSARSYKRKAVPKAALSRLKTSLCPAHFYSCPVCSHLRALS